MNISDIQHRLKERGIEKTWEEVRDFLLDKGFMQPNQEWLRGEWQPVLDAFHKQKIEEKRMTKIYSAEEYFNHGSGIVTLCGSTKFFFEAMECNRILTFKNWMVLMCGSWGHSFHKYDPSIIERDYSVVKKLHFQKILESQAVILISDKSGYIGNSTKAEIRFAAYRNIPVFSFDGEKFYGETTRIPLDKLKDTSLVDEFAENHGGLGF